MSLLNAKRIVSTLRFGSLLLLLLLVEGCSLTQPNTELLTTEQLTPGPVLSSEQAHHHWQKQTEQLATLTHWQIMGKIGLINDDEAIALNLFWQQQGDDYQITMSNLFGTPVIEMKKQGSTLWLRLEQEQEYWGSDPQALIQNLTGWQLPIDQMAYWLKGLPGDADYHLSNQGVIKTATLNTKPKWQLNYKQYQYWKTLLLPKKWVLTSEQNKVKLAISEWKIKPTKEPRQ